MSKRTGPNRSRRPAYLCGEDMTLVEEPSNCPRNGEHTPCPAGYLAWHTWARQMSRTHRCIRCAGCGLFRVWVPKVKRAPRTSTEPARRRGEG